MIFIVLIVFVQVVVCCVIGNGGLGVLVYAVVGVVRNNRSLVVFTNTIAHVVRGFGDGGLVPLHLGADELRCCSQLIRRIS